MQYSVTSLRKRTNLPTKDKLKVLMYTYFIKKNHLLKEDNLSTKDKTGPLLRGSTVYSVYIVLQL